jgi:sodium/potassium-transporting ATPase subunit alpha
MQYDGLLSVRIRRVSVLNYNPLWGPRRDYLILVRMVGTVLVAITNLCGPGLERIFETSSIPGMFWGFPFPYALGILIADEIRKLIVRTYPKVS